MVKSYFPDDTPEELEARVVEVTRAAAIIAAKCGSIPTILVNGVVYWSMPDGNNIETYNGDRNTSSYEAYTNRQILIMAIQTRIKLAKLGDEYKHILEEALYSELLEINASLREKYPTQSDVLFDKGEL
jgi:hypothetical protein